MPKPKFEYTQDQVEALMMGIYMDIVDVDRLPRELYFATANYIKSGLYEGYGGDLASFGYDDPDYKLLNSLRTNTYIFSGAKTYQQYKHINSMVYQDNEKLSYKIFKEKALDVFDEYNLNFLKTEWETAITSATTAKQWQDLQEHIDTFPYLRYNTVLDERTSDICRAISGTTLRSDDPFWHTHVPPQHFNCRCLIEPIDRTESPKLTTAPKMQQLEQYLDKEVNPVFKMNPGRDRYVFSPKHPYFQIEPQDQAKAKKNFGLPIPKKDGK